MDKKVEELEKEKESALAECNQKWEDKMDEKVSWS